MSGPDDEHPTMPRLPSDPTGSAPSGTVSSRPGNSDGNVARPGIGLGRLPPPPRPIAKHAASQPPVPPTSNVPPPTASQPAATPLPSFDLPGSGSNPDPDEVAIAPEFKHLEEFRDPEISMEIPPPAQLEENRPAGAKDPYIGTTFDHRYKIERLLGEGGMGFVYLGRHKVIDKKVAVKVLRAEFARDEEIFNRFVQEARSASTIGNPHIIDISDFGDLPDGSKYFVMEYLEGVSLSQVIDSSTQLNVERICHIAMQLADGLAGAHNAKIVHRDLKPDNVYLITRGNDSDFVKILDFGIAKVSTSSENRLTRAGAVFGTPHYMSPEQAAGAPIDHRTDIYSLGVMLYEMVARQLPFNADNFMGILTQHMYKAPVPIRALVNAPDCPPGLEAVILKCLSKKPEGRYQSMEDLRVDLEKVKSGNVPGAVAEMMARSGGFNVPHDFFKPKPILPATPPQPQRKPWPTYVWIAGATAAVGIVTAIFVIGSNGHTTPSPSVTVPDTAPPATTQAPKVKTVSVAIAAFPESAKAFRDGVELKLPSTIEVEEGKTVLVELQAEGYISQTVELNGKEQSKLVKLVPDKSKPTTAKPIGPRVNPPATAKTGSADVVDPWKR